VPAAAILTMTLLAAIHPRLQGILITGVAITLFYPGNDANSAN